MIVPDKWHSHSKAHFSPISLWMVDYLIDISIVFHMDEIARLLDGSTIESPLVFMQSRGSKHLPFFVNMILNDNFIPTVRTF